MPTVRSKGIAILLLDVENLQLTPEMEAFLQSQCDYRIAYKIAFANWRSLGNTDQVLHERGYDLIQVPGGKDAADGKMITFGCQLHEFYGKAKAAFVCSSDAVMVSLCNCLLQQGLEVYRVLRQDSQIKVLKYPNGSGVAFGTVAKTEQVAAYLAKDDSNLEGIEQELVQIIHDVAADKKTIELAQLALHYMQRHGESITKTLKQLKLGGDFKKFVDKSEYFTLQKVNNVLTVAVKF